MCKIAGVNNITDKNRHEVWTFMQLLGEEISKGNNDGLGYAAFDKSGKIFGEKWLLNQTAFTDLSNVPSLTAAKMNHIYSFFGEKVVRQEALAIVLHTRAATCGKGIENTHPFVDNHDNPEVAIIHNGIIYNHDEFEKKFSTCDSEVLAHLYKENKVNEDLSNLNKFSGDLMGWYTVLSLAKDKNGKMIMDAYTDNGRLESFYIKELGTTVYSSNGDDIKKVAKFLNMTVSDRRKLKAMSSLRIDVLSGQIKQMGTLVSKPAPVRKPFFPELSGNVSVAEGTLDDDEFRRAWFQTVGHSYNGRD